MIQVISLKVGDSLRDLIVTIPGVDPVVADGIRRRVDALRRLAVGVDQATALRNPTVGVAGVDELVVPPDQPRMRVGLILVQPAAIQLKQRWRLLTTVEFESHSKGINSNQKLINSEF